MSAPPFSSNPEDSRVNEIALGSSGFLKSGPTAHALKARTTATTADVDAVDATVAIRVGFLKLLIIIYDFLPKIDLPAQWAAHISKPKQIKLKAHDQER